ncbi:MAG: rRNA maturation RNase YbeY [Hyphomicrobiaceae bacterium]
MGDPGDSSAAGGETDSGSESEPEPPLAVDVVEDGGDWSAVAPVEPLLTAAAAALAAHVAFDPPGAEVAAVLSCNAQVRRLNRLWRGRDEPTNVLSAAAPSRFALPEGRRHLGAVVLAAETVFREAVERGMPPTHYVRHLFVHGVLHLLGYDHENDAAAENMEALEAKILARLGIADPYA